MRIDEEGEVSAVQSQSRPQIWLTVLVRKLPGYDRALDVKWVRHDLGSLPRYAEEIAAYCVCQRPSLTSADIVSGLTSNYITMRRLFGVVPQTWLGRCEQCGSIHWCQE